MAVKVTFKVEGPDAELVERLARSACWESEGNCPNGKRCATRDKCPIDDDCWRAYLDDAALALKVIRETHDIMPQETK